jgi:hypothetical protein
MLVPSDGRAGEQSAERGLTDAVVRCESAHRFAGGPPPHQRFVEGAQPRSRDDRIDAAPTVDSVRSGLNQRAKRRVFLRLSPDGPLHAPLRRALLPLAPQPPVLKQLPPNLLCAK